MTHAASRLHGSTALPQTSARSQHGWVPGPRRPQLAARSAHVWRADLTTVAEDVLGALSPGEHARAVCFPHDRSAILWARGRGVLRALLGRYLDIEPATAEFPVDGHGKPSLVVPGRNAPLSFNLSHSGPLALYAFAEAAAVGVDVQTPRARATDEIAIARRALGAEEASQLARLEPTQRDKEFLRAWTRHEAISKCRGTGILIRGDTNDERCDMGAPWVVDLELGAEAAGALAVALQPDAVRCFNWTG